RDIRIPHPRPYDRPVMIAAGVEEIVEIDRLVGAVKIADADMNDAGAKVAASIFRSRDACGQARERRRGEFDAHDSNPPIKSNLKTDAFAAPRLSVDSSAVLIEPMQVRFARRDVNG